MLRVALCLAALFAATSATLYTADLGNDAINGLSALGNIKNKPPLETPTPNSAWQPYDGSCVPGRGILYTIDGVAPSKEAPLAVYYTEAGQIAGMQVTVFGTGKGMIQGNIGDAAPTNLVNQGFWNVDISRPHTWTMSVSFRDSSLMCNQALQDTQHKIGDRLIINQGSLDYSIPLTAADAIAEGFQPGACLPQMGQHFTKDLTVSSPGQSWDGKNLLPVIPMYYPDGPKKDTIHAFFMTTPVLQHGSRLSGNQGWDAIPIPSNAMCLNWCNTACTWVNTNLWSTMHIFLDSDFKNLKCQGATGLKNKILGRTCPSGVIGKSGSIFASESEAEADINTSAADSGDATLPILVGVFGVALLAVAVVATVWRQRAANRGTIVLP